MTELTWYLEKAKDILDYWYKASEQALSLIDKYPVTHWLLQSQRHKQNADCKRAALHRKTAGLVWHDRYKMLLDCQRSYTTMRDT